LLFNSYFFIFVFLPVTLLGFYLIGRLGEERGAVSWLVFASLFFYAWWNPAYLLLLISSILLNYIIGLLLASKPNKSVLIIGICINLSVIAYYKYANFLVDNINPLFSGNIVLEKIVLPLAISFFTFQQIAYLVDSYQGKVQEHGFLHYCLFVTFFPQLIAGPIVHHKDMLPQFMQNMIGGLNSRDVAIGLTIFFMGLFKKVVFADGIAVYATPVFDVAEQGVALTFFEAWGGAMAYSLQLYFDFSAYSDMAIGLARMFGIILPVNFFSPYKAHNIIEFWRRWHITLSQFLRDYLYISLGGNRKGSVRRYLNLMITMLLGGLWHGAGWTFVIWGGLHGVYLMINHGWHVIKKNLFHWQSESSSMASVILGRIITFIAIVVAWVLFRADSLDGALVMYKAMFGINGISLPVSFQPYLVFLGDSIIESLNISYRGMFYHNVFGEVYSGCLSILCLLLIAWFAPNTLEWMKKENPALGLERMLVKGDVKLQWNASPAFAVLTAMIAVYSLMGISGESEFLYFRF